MRRFSSICVLCLFMFAAVASDNALSPPVAKAATATDLALGKPVTASSIQDGQLAAKYAVDGSMYTRWSSAWSDPQWIYVDLGSVYKITGVTLHWERAYGKAFDIQVSNNATNWTNIYNTTSGTGGTQALTGLSGSGRYVRMYGTARGTGWGYSLWEFDVYGTSVTADPPATPANTSAPAISGTAEEGDTLTASNGSWSNNPASYAYQWQDCTSASSCSNISGATSSTYTLQSSDVGKTVDVVVTATNAGGSTPASSAQTETVTAAPPAKPVNTSAPTVSGTAQQGDALTASNGSWSSSPTSYAYQWQDCTSASSCSNISGATSSTYTLQPTDVSKTIDVVVTATNAGGSTPATSAQTGTVTSSGGTGGSGGSGISPLHVVGNKLETANGQTAVLHGTDISGSAYACEQNGGYGFSDTPSGSSLYAPMLSWHLNSVTIGLDQDCWLGINGVQAQYSGQNYINWVKAQVTSAESNGIYPVIGFFVGEPGTDTPDWSSTGNGNAPMPDNDHAPLMWEEIANAFKNDPNVIFRVYEEPWPDFYGSVNAAWECWSSGDVQYGTSSDSTLPTGWQSSPGTQTPPTPTGSTGGCGGSSSSTNPEQSDGNGHTYQSIGFQSLINIIRGTGAQNIIQVPGIAFANALTCTNTGNPNTCGFLQPGIKVNDPLANTDPSLGQQLMADTDNYPDSGQFMNSLTTVRDAYGPVEQVMPIDMGEAGVEGNPSSFPLIEQFIDQYDSWGQSYYLSQWESWANLISNYNGTPAGGWGTWAYDHMTGAS